MDLDKRTHSLVWAPLEQRQQQQQQRQQMRDSLEANWKKAQFLSKKINSLDRISISFPEHFPFYTKHSH